MNDGQRGLYRASEGLGLKYYGWDNDWHYCWGLSENCLREYPRVVEIAEEEMDKLIFFRELID